MATGKRTHNWQKDVKGYLVSKVHKNSNCYTNVVMVDFFNGNNIRVAGYRSKRIKSVWEVNPLRDSAS